MIRADILVIDDDPRVCKSLELAFPEYRFTNASDGEEGLTLLDRPHEFDLVILDVKMAGLSGLDVLGQIKKKERALNVIILTGYGEKDVVVGALRGRADDFVDKPFRVDLMRSAIERCLERRRIGRLTGDGTDTVSRTRRFIEKNYEKFLTLESAAQAWSMSPKYLSRKFKEKTGEGFTAFRNRLRVERAKELLHDSSLLVHEIAEKVGYQNAESFMKMFKKTTGITPTAYRTRPGRPRR